MRRHIFPAAMVMAVLAIMPFLFAPARAQEATPTDGGLTGYPKLTVTITNDAYLLDAEPVAAGWVILSATNQSDNESGIIVVGPPAGMTGDDMEQMASTPEPNGDIPSWLLKAKIAGGQSGVLPGETLESIVYLPAGDWAVTGDGDQAATRFTTADGPDSVTTEPTGTLSFELGDVYFGGLANGLPSGPQIAKITNSGQQLHMMVLAKGPDSMTMDQVMDAVSMPDGATPAPGGLQESDLTFVPGVTLISPGQTMYLPLNLEPGTYFALCFVTDPTTGMLHVMEGMAAIFVVN